LWRHRGDAWVIRSYLDKKGAVGRLDVEISRARTDKAAADVAALEARIKQCTIVAPYDGRVSELLVNAHETPTPGKPLISLVDETTFEIDLIVPSHWLRKLAMGANFSFSVDELGTTHTAKLVRIGAAVDAVSQSVKVIGRFDVKPERVLSGMSGNAVFEGQVQ
jgi:multidrug efflux pump subunit AcrA (membrane-fusion protein)